MFIRTRESSGDIFYLGTAPNREDETYISAWIHQGELQVKIKYFNASAPEKYTVGGVRLDNGYNHLIQVSNLKYLINFFYANMPV